MTKTLVVVESSAKAKSIKKFLGKNYSVKASMGHIRDLPKSQFGVDVNNDFRPKYITIRGKGNIIKELRQSVKKASRVLLAPDPDREGEAIAWHLYKALDLEKDERCRIEFNEITKQAVKEAVRHPRVIDLNRVNAQQARRILDRVVGYRLSPLLWRKVKKGLSAGRVQSVAVRLICEREEEINQFVPEEYWTLTAHLSKKKGRGRKPVTFEAKLVKIGEEKAEISNARRAQEIMQDLEDAEYIISKIKRREKKRKPAPPFTTSSLQQEAYRKLNFNARKTMVVAQQLYEGLDVGREGTTGLITYIRTDSTRISEVAREEAKKYIEDQFGMEYVSDKVYHKGAKGRVQDAHEAIRPTSVLREPDKIKKYLTKDQYKLYNLIWSRFVSSQMKEAVFDTTSVDIKARDYTFRGTGSVLVFPGFMKVYIEGTDNGEKEEDKLLPELKEGEILKLKELEPKQHFTQPPPRYTDATLVKLLEEKGIGRPSTYAPIIDTILKRGYVVREDKKFYPTELGFIVVDMLKEYFPDIMDVEFTAEMEDRLDSIEEGRTDWVQLLKGFYKSFDDAVKKAENELSKVEVKEEVTDEVCEKCGRNMVVKMGRYGKFLACPAFPECRNTKPFLEPIGVKCPECGEGEIVVKRSKKGRKFYGCSNYPECKFISWDLPTNKKCPVCGSLMVEKKSKGKVTYCCINEECGFKQKQEQEASRRSLQAT